MMSHSHCGVSGVISRMSPRLVLGHALEYSHRAVGPERRSAGRHLVEHAAEAEEVGPLVELLPLACSGAMYIGVPAISPLCEMVASSAAGQSEVGDLYPLGTALEQHIARLDVAVDQVVASAAASPSAICRPTRTTSAGSTGPTRLSRCCRVSPGMNSMAIYGNGCSPTS